MSLVVLVVLAVVWAVFLLPQLFRARAERSTDSIGAFQHQLSVLERTTPSATGPVTRMQRPLRPRQAVAGRALARPAAVATSVAPVRAAAPRRQPSGRAAARKRRRDVFCGLLVAMGASLVLGLVPALRLMLAVHLVIDVLFVAYVALLVRARNLATERELKVRFLPTVSPTHPALLLRRSAN